MFTNAPTLINGTSLQGTIRTTRAHIESVFGAPTYDNGDPEDKVITEWQLTFDNGVIATIYDWKNYAKVGMNDPYDWHIGGKDYRAVEAVSAAL